MLPSERVLREEMRAGNEQLREKMRAGDAQLRGETRGCEERLGEEIQPGDEETRRVLREEIRAGNEETRQLREEMRVLIADTRTHMLVLHEDVLSRFALLDEHLNGRRRRPGISRRQGRKKR